MATITVVNQRATYSGFEGALYGRTATSGGTDYAQWFVFISNPNGNSTNYIHAISQHYRYQFRDGTTGTPFPADGWVPSATPDVVLSDASAPAKPTSFSVSATGQAFRLQAMVDNGGSPITKWQYKIATTAAGLASASWVDIYSTSDALDFTTGNIGYDTTRYFQVRAINAVGTGPDTLTVATVTISDRTVTWSNFSSAGAQPLQFRQDGSGGTNYGAWTTSSSFEERSGSRVLGSGAYGIRYQFRDGPSGTPFPTACHVVSSIRTGTYTAPPIAPVSATTGPSPDSTPPGVSSAETNTAGTQIIITFNETLDAAHVPAASAFSVSGSPTVSSVSLSGATVVLALSGAYVFGDTITVGYTQPSAAGSRIQDAAGNHAGSFSGRAVANNVPLAVPGAVRNLADSARTDASITWGWDAPSTGGAVASYEYRTAQGSASFSGSWTTTGSNRSATVTGLSASTSYRIQVRARNASGPGAAATDTASTTAQLPVVTTDTDSIYILGATAPATPTGGTNTESHLPTGWSRTEPDPSRTENVYRSQRTRTFTDGTFTSATAWGAPAKVADALGSNDQTITLPAARYAYREPRRKEWNWASSSGSGAPAIDESLRAGAALRYVVQVRLWRTAANQVGGRILAVYLEDQRAYGSLGTGDDLSSLFESDGSVTLTLDTGESITGLMRLGGDTLEQYAFINQADGSTVGFTDAEFDAVFDALSTTSGSEAATLVIRDFEPEIARRFIGTGTAAFRAAAAATLTNVPIVTTAHVAAIGGAAFSGAPAALLARTVPTPRLVAGVGTAAFLTPSAATLTRIVPPPLPYTLDLPHDALASTDLQNRWRGTIPSGRITGSSIDRDIEVISTDSSRIGYGIDIIIGQPSGGSDAGRFDLTDELEDARLFIQNADGSTTFWSGIIGDLDSSEPYIWTITSAEAAALAAYTGTLRLRFETALIGIVGTGEATFQGSVAATLALTAPTGRRFAGSAEATFNLPAAAILTLTGPRPTRFAGTGSAAFEAATATLGRIPGARAVGLGTGAFRAAANALLTVIVQPERFAGAGVAAFRSAAAAALARIPPAPIRFSQTRARFRRALFQAPTSAVLTKHVPRRFAGTGAATFRAPAAAPLSPILPTERRFAGVGQAAFRAAAAAVLSRTVPTALRFAGAGTATLEAPGAATLSRLVARYFTGQGAAAFRAAAAAALDSPTPAGRDETVARARAHRRDLTRDSDLFALKITHPDISSPIRVVADTQDVEIDGDTFTALAFRAVPPNFQEGETPRAVLEIDNVGRELTQWIERTGGGRGAMMEVMQVHRDPDVPNVGHVTWSLPALPVGVTEVTNEVVQVALAYRTGRSRPGIKWRHDYETSPGVFAG